MIHEAVADGGSFLLCGSGLIHGVRARLDSVPRPPPSRGLSSSRFAETALRAERCG